VFAKKAGAVAAPTAGLHFSQEMMARLREKGIEQCELTLDVGLGTFQPIHSETLEQHVMHAEHYEISAETAERSWRPAPQKEQWSRLERQSFGRWKIPPNMRRRANRQIAGRGQIGSEDFHFAWL